MSSQGLAAMPLWELPVTPPRELVAMASRMIVVMIWIGVESDGGCKGLDVWG